MNPGTFLLAIAAAMHTALAVTSTHLTRSQTRFSRRGDEGAAREVGPTPRRATRAMKWRMARVISLKELAGKMLMRRTR